jgi:hypothetical protein
MPTRNRRPIKPHCNWIWIGPLAVITIPLEELSIGAWCLGLPVLAKRQGSTGDWAGERRLNEARPRHEEDAAAWVGGRKGSAVQAAAEAHCLAKKWGRSGADHGIRHKACHCGNYECGRAEGGLERGPKPARAGRQPRQRTARPPRSHCAGKRRRRQRRQGQRVGSTSLPLNAAAR